MTALGPPLLSAYDPVESLEGTIDPLRTQALFEKLAESILPFVTARMKRPRFVTAIAVGAVVRRNLPAESADGRVPAWIAFEWLVIGALVRSGLHDEGGSTRIPGLLKVRSALRGGHGVGAATYLKTPKIFGFTGIYRRLGLGLNVLNDELELDEGGHELLRAWEKNVGVDGFTRGSGAGKTLLDRVRRSLDAALSTGHARSFGALDELARTLDPGTCTPAEAELLFERLADPRLGSPKDDPAAAAMRRELLFAVRDHGTAIDREGERGFLRKLVCSQELRSRLDRVLAFEEACRIAEDALHLVLHLSTARRHGYVGPTEFAAAPQSAPLLARVQASLDDLETRFAGHPLEQDVARTFDRYREATTPARLFELVIAHHKEAQRAKPPEPKRTWFVERDREVAARMAFARVEPPKLTRAFVHEYRLPSVSSFLQDLGRL